MISENSLKKKLEKSIGKKIVLSVKDNKTVFLRVKYKKDLLILMLHRVFLKANSSILKLLKTFLIKREKAVLKELRKFIALKTQKTKIVKHRGLKSPIGVVYNLNALFEEVNAAYFDSKLKIQIFWFKKPVYKTFSSITFGLFDTVSKIIKVNEILDDANIPKFVLLYIIYHETLHFVYPAKKNIFHSKEFKMAEKKFKYYREAESFLRNFLKTQKKNALNKSLNNR